MSKIREILNVLLKKQNDIVDKITKEDCEDNKEFKKLIFLKAAERELDYLEDLAKFYGE